MATKKKRTSRADARAAKIDAIRAIAGHPDTLALFDRAHTEPHVLSLEVKESGVRIEFQALHPKHALALLDALNALRKPAVPS